MGSWVGPAVTSTRGARPADPLGAIEVFPTSDELTGPEDFMKNPFANRACRLRGTLRYYEIPGIGIEPAPPAPLVGTPVERT